ncbi:MAG: PKD domain-containing protein, partial [Candidatus Competibacteraceae bacterium]|nr:PKD domain-containing protein [Candidatus Competibacteraceae bacterium]
MVNLSTRGPVERDDGLLIGGFVIGGTTPKTVLIRGLRPSLAGVVPGALEDPWLELYTGGESPARLTSNDQWQSQAATAAAVQAVGLAPPDAREAVILATLPPGPYTALLRGVEGGTGIGLVEIIEVDTSRAWLAQGSGRSPVGTGDAVAIGGFTLAGTTPKTVLIRGLGPSLGSVLRGALADPQIRLFAGDGQELAANNNWQDTQAAEILASGMAPAHLLDAAILTTLPPGAYSVILSGVDGGSGVGLLEVQEISAAPPRLISLSNRALAQTGEQSLISGVLIQGDTLKTLVVRALGPSLAGVLNGVLGDPRLRILAADGTELAANDQWADAAGAATLQALGLAPTDPLEAALLVTLPPGAYTVQVDGANGGGLSLTDIHDTANLLHNQRPQVHAGRGQTLTWPTNTVTLQGTVSDDGLPQPPGAVTVQWSQGSGPASVVFADPQALQTTATFPQAGSYWVQLSADDGRLSATDQILLTVLAEGSTTPPPSPPPAPPPPGATNQAPQVNAGNPQTITLPTNSVTLNGVVTDDGLPNPPGAVTVGWSQISGLAGVTWANAAAASTTATFPGAGTYVLRLTANDGALIRTSDVTITVNPASGGGGGGG